MRSHRHIVVFVLAFNEENSIRDILTRVKRVLPGADICLINDCSIDSTKELAHSLDCTVLDLACNLGVGGAMQAGFGYAYENGYDIALRLDGDGQHPPEEAYKLLDRIQQGDVDLVVGSRFLVKGGYTSSTFRLLGIRGLAAFLSSICRQTITDPTSGFQAVNRAVMFFFSHQYPSDYPEPESLALLSRQGYRFTEVSTHFKARQYGDSSLGGLGSLFYAFKVYVALIVDRCRAVNPRFDRAVVKDLI